jgi:hypothetical protein
VSKENIGVIPQLLQSAAQGHEMKHGTSPYYPGMPQAICVIIIGNRIIVESSVETWHHIKPTDVGKRREARKKRIENYKKGLLPSECAKFETLSNYLSKKYETLTSHNDRAYFVEQWNTGSWVAEDGVKNMKALQIPGTMVTYKPSGDPKAPRFACACRFRCERLIDGHNWPKEGYNRYCYPYESCAEPAAWYALRANEVA